MEILFSSIFSKLIIFITIHFLIKAFVVAYKRRDISFRSFIVCAATSVTIGIYLASNLLLLSKNIPQLWKEHKKSSPLAASKLELSD